MKGLQARLGGLLRPSPFRLGVLTGLGLFVLMWLLIYLLFFWPNPTPKYDVEVVSVGADVSRHGGHMIVVTNRGAVVFKSICNDGCDDIWYRTQSAGEGSSYAAKVLDISRNCVACYGEAYLGTTPLDGVARWTFAGHEKLNDELRYYHPQRDGSLQWR